MDNDYVGESLPAQNDLIATEEIHEAIAGRFKLDPVMTGNKMKDALYN